MSKYGIDTSVENKSLTSGDMLDKSFSTNEKILHVHKSGEFKFSSSGIGFDQTLTIFHGLGYFPTYLAYSTVPYNNGVTSSITTNKYLLNYGDEIEFKMFPYYTQAWVDKTNLYIRYRDDIGDKILTFRGYYYIFKNRI